MICMTTSITLMPERLTKKREDANLSQEGLAVLVGKAIGRPSFHQTNISSYERGSKTPSLSVFRALAQILETNMEWLAGETDDDKPSSDLEDQIIIGVKDPAERALLQEMMDIMLAASSEDRRYIAGLVRRLAAAPKPPTPIIIGGEPTNRSR